MMKEKSKWLVMASVASGVFLGTIDGSIVSVGLPTIQKELQSSQNLLQWVVTGYMLVNILGLIPFGRLGDLVGRRKIYLIGLSIFLFASLGCGFAPTIHLLILARLFQAIGGGMMVALGMGIISETFPQKERGKALGIMGLVVSVGVISGPILGGFIIQYLLWRGIFLINIPIGIVVFILSYLYLPHSLPQGKNEKSDFLKILKNKILLNNVLTAFFLFIPLSGIGYLMPFYLENITLRTAQETGFLMAATPLFMGMTAPFSGILSDKYGAFKIKFLGTLFFMLGCYFVSTLPQYVTNLGYFARYAFMGVGIGMFQSPNNSSTISSVEKKDIGTASSLASFARMLGSVAGVFLCNFLALSFSQNQNQFTYESIIKSIIIVSFLSFVAFLFIISSFKTQKEKI